MYSPSMQKQREKVKEYNLLHLQLKKKGGTEGTVCTA